MGETVKQILLEEFVKVQARNPNYSMRSYAKKIGVGQSTVSEVLSGKRPLTKKNAVRILRGLDRSPEEILTAFNDDTAAANPKYKSLDMDTFHIISSWHHYAILSLAETEDFQSSDAWIARRLGITKNQAAEAIEKLLRLNMLDRDPRTGNLKATGQQFEAISPVASPALRKANRQNLELASQALENIPVNERDFTAMTLCMDPNRIEEARKMIKNFRRNFNRVMDAGRKKEVYKLSVQLFPLSKSEAK